MVLVSKKIVFEEWKFGVCLKQEIKV